MSIILEGPQLGAFGYFNCVVKNSDGTIKKDYGWQHNLITQKGLNGQCDLVGGWSFYSNMPKIVIGTGSGTPSVADTQLFERLTSYNEAPDNYTYAPDTSYKLPNDLKIKLDHLYPNGYNYGGRKWKNTFSNINNKNLTEIGIAHPTNYTLYTHAMITDETGTPSAITILQGEILEVEYWVWFIIPYMLKRGTFKLKKTPDMAIPEQYTEEEYDYQLQVFGEVNKNNNGTYYSSSSSKRYGSNFQIKIPDDATPGPVDFDKWIVPWRTKKSDGTNFTSNIVDLFTTTNAKNATFFVNMDQEYRTKNLSTIYQLGFVSYDDSSYLKDFLVDNYINGYGGYDKNGAKRLKLYNNKYTVDGFYRTTTIAWTPFTKDNLYKGLAPNENYNNGNLTNNGSYGDNGLRGLFFTGSLLGDFDSYNDSAGFFDASTQLCNGAQPNMMVIFSKKGTGEGIKKEWGWFLEVTLGFNASAIDVDSIKIVEANMDTSKKVLDQTYTLDLTYEEGATYNVEIQSLVDGVTPEELVSLNGLTLTQVAQTGSFNVKVTVSKGDMVPRTFTQSFTIASSN